MSDDVIWRHIVKMSNNFSTLKIYFHKGDMWIEELLEHDRSISYHFWDIQKTDASGSIRPSASTPGLNNQWCRDLVNKISKGETVPLPMSSFCLAVDLSSSLSVAYLGGPLGNGPSFGKTNLFFTIGKKLESIVWPPLCEHLWPAKIWPPPFWNPQYATVLHHVVANKIVVTSRVSEFWPPEKLEFIICSHTLVHK